MTEPTNPFDPPAQHRRAADDGQLRLVIVLWCFWLLGAWAVAWVSDTSVPRVRWMMFAGALGLMLLWPAYRLSERSAAGRMGSAVWEVLVDWLALVGVYQAVVWSLHLIAGWPLMRGVWLDAAVVSWSLCSALIVACARLWPGAWPRWVGMLLCLALVGAEPLAVWVSVVNGGAGWAMRVSPIQALYEMTGPIERAWSLPWDQQVMAVGFVGVSGWVALWLWSLGRGVARLRGGAEKESDTLTPGQS